MKRPYRILGWLIIISSIGAIFFECTGIDGAYDLLPMAPVVSLIHTLAVHPGGLIWFYYEYFHLPVFPAGVSIYVLWKMLVIFCGVSIVLYKEVGRRVFIVLNALHISSILLFHLTLSLLLLKPSYLINPQYHPFIRGNLLINLSQVLDVLLPIAYVVYLTRPKVKEQFKTQYRNR